ncbi:MAG: cobalt ECF transporter T component CbiQ [Methanosarcinales archaeon]
MLDHPWIDRFASLDSPIHRFDPRAKAITFLFLIFSIVLLSAVKLALVGLLTSIFFLALSRLPLRFALRHIKWVSLFIIPFFIVMPFTVEGSEIYGVHGLKVTYEGIEYGALIALRALSAVILVLPMIATTRFEEMMKALERLKVPSIMVQMLIFTYHYIFVFGEEWERMWRAIESRGFRLRTTLYALRTLGRAMGMLFVKSYERSERVYYAMRSRGYTGHQRTLAEFNLKRSDLVLSTLIISIGVILHIIQMEVM